MTPRGVNAIRRELVAGALAIALIPKRVCEAAAVLPRVVWLGPPSPDFAKHIQESFAKHGLAVGRDLSMTVEDIDDNREVAERDVRRIVASRPAAIAGPAVLEMWLMKRLTHEVPIVFHNLTTDPVRVGLVESMRMPGGNMTGTCHSQQWQARMLSLLREIDPRLRIVGLLIGRETLAAHEAREYLREGEARVRQADREDAARHGIETREIIVPEASTEREIGTAVVNSGVQALIVGFPMTDAFVGFLGRTRIPTASLRVRPLRKGILVCTTFDWDEGEDHACQMVVRILRGESPATIPIYRQTKYFTGVNLRTAKRIGVRIPDSLIVQAAEIVR